MLAISATSSLLDCPAPSCNNIDFPATESGAQKEAFLKEAKSSLAFAVLRASGTEKKLHMVVPLPCPADCVCLADMASTTLRLANKRVKSLATGYDLEWGKTFLLLFHGVATRRDGSFARPLW